MNMNDRYIGLISFILNCILLQDIVEGFMDYPHFMNQPKNLNYDET